MSKLPPRAPASHQPLSQDDQLLEPMPPQEVVVQLGVQGQFREHNLLKVIGHSVVALPLQQVRETNLMNGAHDPHLHVLNS